MSFSLTKAYEDFWIFEENQVRFFLITGTERSLLIDSGWGAFDLKAEVEKITGLPVTLVNTHSDGDHIGGNWRFKDDIWIHPGEIDILRKKMKAPELQVNALQDGQVFDLGGRRLKVICCPGHTVGSTALFEEERGILFSGDTVSHEPIFMFGNGRDYDSFIASQHMFKKLRGSFRTIYPCHGPYPIAPDEIFDDLALLMQSIMGGAKTTEKQHLAFPDAEFDVYCHRRGNAAILTFAT